MKINHVGIVVKNIEKSIEYYKTYFEFQSDNVIYGDSIQKVRIAFVKPPN